MSVTQKQDMDIATLPKGDMFVGLNADYNHLIVGIAGAGKTYFGVREEIMWNAQNGFNLLIIGRIGEHSRNKQILKEKGYTVKEYHYYRKGGYNTEPCREDFLTPKTAIFWETEELWTDAEFDDMQAVFHRIIALTDVLPYFTTVIIDDITIYSDISLARLSTAKQCNVRYVWTAHSYSDLCHSSVFDNFAKSLLRFGTHDYFNFQFGLSDPQVKTYLPKIFSDNSFEIHDGLAIRKCTV